MTAPVRARRLTDYEGQRLLAIMRRGKHDSIRVRRALIIMASASGTTVPAIARLVAAHEDTVRDVIHAVNREGPPARDPGWAAGRPRRIGSDDEHYIVETATTRPERLARPFTHWSVRKLAGYLGENPTRRVRIGRERPRQILRRHEITFQRTRTWKESRAPDMDTKLDRIEEVTGRFPDRCFAFDQFRPLRSFVIGNSSHPNHIVLTRKLQAYPRWRYTHHRHPDVLGAQRRERARIRSQKAIRFGGRPLTTAA